MVKIKRLIKTFLKKDLSVNELHVQAAEDLERYLKEQLPKEIPFYVLPVTKNLENVLLVTFKCSHIRFSTLIKNSNGAVDLPEKSSAYAVIYKFEGIND